MAGTTKIRIRNRDIVDIFDRVADMLEIRGENPFRVRAYRNAARTIENLSSDVADLVERHEDLSQYPNIGRDLANKIHEIVDTGTLNTLKELEKHVPRELPMMMKIAGLGPKRVATIYRYLEVRSLDDLRKAAEKGEIRQLPGFGKKVEQQILEEVARLTSESAKRLPLPEAQQYARRLLDYLHDVEGVKEVVIAGSFRRRRETVRDLDILAVCRDDCPLMEEFTDYEYIDRVVSRGPTRATVVLRSGLQVDLRVVSQESFGAALVYFTGSKEHSIELRKIAGQNDWKLNEYGLFDGERSIAGRTEQEIYRKLGLDYVEPELRENLGEIQAAAEHRLPQLIAVDGIRGDLHVHSSYSDGRNTIRQMAEAARERGYEYIALTDHSQRVTIAGGLAPDDVLRQFDEVDRENEQLKGLRILKSSEVDILEDGGLDLPDEVLRRMDIRICAIHSKFKLDRQQQTERILRAMESPFFNVFAHPTGRRMQQRPGYDIDMERIMKAAAARGIALELNGNPDRLDLNDIHCRMARDLGVPIVISTDAHKTADLDFIRYGIDQARRGWLEPANVLNTRPLKELLKWVAQRSS